MGIGLVRVGAVIGRSHATHQISAASEHVFIRRHGRYHAPFCAGIDGGQVRTSMEHALEKPHVSCVETGQVKTGQTSATIEHEMHKFHVGRVEVAQIKTRQTTASIEHVLHIVNLTGI